MADYLYTLKADLKVMFQLITPEHKEKLQIGFSQLSKQSRKYRFFNGLSRLPDSYLEYLTRIDNKNHLAWGVEDLNIGDKGVAVGRYIRINNSSVAEMALTVLDEYQRKGIGTLLLRHLIHSALGNDIYCLRGYMLKDNPGFLALLKDYTYHIKNTGAQIIQIDLPLETGLLQKYPLPEADIH